MVFDDLSTHNVLEAWSLGYVSDTKVSQALPFETFGEIAFAASLAGLRLGGQVRLRMHLCGDLRLVIEGAMAADGFSPKRIGHILGAKHHKNSSLAA